MFEDVKDQEHLNIQNVQKFECDFINTLAIFCSEDLHKNICTTNFRRKNSDLLSTKTSWYLQENERFVKIGSRNIVKDLHNQLVINTNCG